MYSRLTRSRRFLPVTLGIITLSAVVVLFVWDVIPNWFPARSHDYVAAFSLAMIAVAYVVYQLLHRPGPAEFAKAIMLPVAFLFWAANQLWSNLPQATLFNDIAIGLFVLDVFLVIAGWPPASADASFGETGADHRGEGGL